MTARVFQFPRYAAERSAQLAAMRADYSSVPPAGGRPWGWLFVLSLVGGVWCVLAGYTYWAATVSQGGTGSWLMLSGMAVLAFSAVCLCLWIWGLARGNPAWGRLTLVGLALNYLVGRPVVEAYPWAWPALSMIGWGLLIGLVLRWRQLHHRSPVVQAARRDAATVDVHTVAQTDDAARWAAGAVGEDIVVDALAHLGNDHVVIHNLPLDGRGDVDHVVVGPAGAVVVETKYLAGRVVCQGDGAWFQLKRDEMRQICDPAEQAQRAAEGVSSILAQGRLADVPVYAVLVMAHPRVELDVAQSSALVVRPAELVPQLLQLARSRKRLDAGRVTTAANALLAPRALSPGPRVR